MVARSREVVRCGHPGCSWNSQRRMIKRHTERKHRGKPIRELSDSDIGEGFESDTSHNSEEAPEVLVTSVNPSMVHPYPPELSSNPRILNIEKQIATLRGELLSKIDQLQHTDGTPKIGGFEDDADTHFASCRSIETLKNEAEGMLEVSEENGMIYCKACKENSVGSTGSFPYKFELGTSFDKDAHLPKEFTSLKYKIKRHLRSARHNNNCKKMKPPIETEASRAMSSGTICHIARRVLRTAYHVIRSFYPQKEFSSLVNLQSWNGLDVGDINHSGTLLVKLRDAFHDELTLRVKEFVEEAPCVAILADKVTLKRRTLDILSFHAVIPQAKAGKLIQCVVIGAPEIVSPDIHSEAENWLTVLSNIGIVRPEQLAAIGINEQYQDNSVPQKVLAMLHGHSYEPVCVPTVWNPNHLLELAMSHAKKVEWVNQMINIITSVTKIFKGAKTFTDIGPGATTFRQPILFTDTQWSTTAANVIEIFSNNIPLYKREIEMEKNRGNYLGNWRGDDNVKYFLTYTNDIVLRAAALCDIFTIAGKCSRFLQNIQKLPWEKMEELTNLASIFAQMSSSIKMQGSRCAGQEIMEPFELEKNLAKYWPTLGRCPQLNYVQVNDITVLLDVLTEQSRLRTSNDVLIDCAYDIRRVADLTYARSTRSVATKSKMMLDSFMTLKQKNLVPAHLDLTEICCQNVCHLLQEYQPERTSIHNQELFMYLWSRSDEDMELRAYLHAVIRLWLIYPCESSVDSLATVLKDVFGEHRNLQYANAAKEFIIRWNGPPLGQADHLLEAVDRKLKLKFTRKTNRIKHRYGTVLSRYSEESYPLQDLFGPNEEE